MPRFNGTGPLGEGSQTGRRQGRCGSSRQETTQHVENESRRGFRFRFLSDVVDEFRGRGRGWRAGIGGRRRIPGRGLANRFGD